MHRFHYLDWFPTEHCILSSRLVEVLLYRFMMEDWTQPAQLKKDVYLFRKRQQKRIYKNLLEWASLREFRAFDDWTKLAPADKVGALVKKW